MIKFLRELKNSAQQKELDEKEKAFRQAMMKDIPVLRKMMDRNWAIVMWIETQSNTEQSDSPSLLTMHTFERLRSLRPQYDFKSFIVAQSSESGDLFCHSHIRTPDRWLLHASSLRY